MFASATAIFSAGNSFRWLRDNVCRELLSEKEPYDAMTALAAKSVITSYSIHYTKLYENMPTGARRSGITKPAVFTSRPDTPRSVRCASKSVTTPVKTTRT